MVWLTRYEKELFLLATYAHQNFREWADNEKTNLNKEERKHLRVAATYIAKALKSYGARFDSDQYKSIMALAKNSVFEITRKDTVPQPEMKRLNYNAVLEIANHALWKCCKDTCICPNDDFKKCELFKAMFEAEIPNSGIDAEGCPYKL